MEVERDGEVIASHHERPAGGRQTITLPEHLSGLWHRTLACKAEPPAELRALGLAPFPELAVQQRDLAVYEQFLEATA